MEKKLKSYSDTYLYSKYPLYTKFITDAIMKDPVIDKKTDQFKDVVYEVKRSKVSDALVNILNSTNVILLDCDKPMPKSFKVFCARDIKSKDRAVRVFIDTTGVIEKQKKSSAFNIDETKLISYLINGAVSMVYHKNYRKIIVGSQKNLAVECFAKCFTQIIDYLAKVSIQESSKVKVLYLSAMYFGKGVMGLEDNDSSGMVAKKISGISEREAKMLDVLMEKNSVPKGGNKSEYDPYENIKTFVSAMRETIHLDRKVITTDMVVERWMMMYGPGTVLGLEYFPHFSAMITDAYIGGYLNNQKAIEKVCGTSLVEYTNSIINMVNSIA